jgi:hypothetical protein
VSLKKVLDDKSSNKLISNTIAANARRGSFGTVNHDIDFPLGADQAKDVTRFRKFGGYGNSTDYNAMSGSTFMSPAHLRKTRGFVDFDLQLFRQDMRRPHAHEKRFDPFNYFPKNLTDNKPVRQVDFDKQYLRDDFVYKNVKCSDALFENE